MADQLIAMLEQVLSHMKEAQGAEKAKPDEGMMPIRLDGPMDLCVLIITGKPKREKALPPELEEDLEAPRRQRRRSRLRSMEQKGAPHEREREKEEFL